MSAVKMTFFFISQEGIFSVGISKGLILTLLVIGFQYTIFFKTIFTPLKNWPVGIVVNFLLEARIVLGRAAGHHTFVSRPLCQK